METVDLDELRQNAREYVRQAEAGERLLVSVSGRPAAALVPATERSWRRWDDVAELFTDPADPEWETERELVDQSIWNPWEERHKGSPHGRPGCQPRHSVPTR